ncbi:MAG: enoyl-CoA hydratase/isomerase family protein [Colwellia polaris]|jgi:enoyl-CoA hydratase/carnithine racemase|uniref:enoyl-CoA hydratase/isomerase family protein n=1 Tax=Colwellia polaris TaxID=326537 RepID=UPI000A1754AE|nr:enoyl-CoA hydratase/isomerase family protein [Colwellia polaris]|tara:strand:- start:1656 stop:2819 length:1164 start_codon:yes stop_codon:yes gene_type:complete
MSPVIFSEIKTKTEKRIALAELNAPQSLNALNMSMFELLHKQLLEWQSNDEIAMVILQGSGDKAFCAGGDVVSLYHALKIERENITDSQSSTVQETAETIIDDQTIINSFGYDFFALEYQVDQLIHEFTKPILVWGDGYIMGGGIGLFAGASHKVVTEKTLLAMPEVTIGLYPDVGASWFLNKVSNNTGLFLGITGAIFNAVDALNIGLANVAIKSSVKSEVISSLSNVQWQTNHENYELLDKALNKFVQQSEQAFASITSNVVEHQAIIKQLTNFDNGADIYQAILALDTESDWLQRAQAKLRKGSPLSALIIYQQLLISKDFTLEQCFASELNLSLRCCQYPEFSEGVRALLVDKDKSPRWQYENINDIPAERLAWFFAPVEKLN